MKNDLLKQIPLFFEKSEHYPQDHSNLPDPEDEHPLDQFCLGGGGL